MILSRKVNLKSELEVNQITEKIHSIIQKDSHDLYRFNGKISGNTFQIYPLEENYRKPHLNIQINGEIKKESNKSVVELIIKVPQESITLFIILIIAIISLNTYLFFHPKTLMLNAFSIIAPIIISIIIMSEIIIKQKNMIKRLSIILKATYFKNVG